MATLVGVFDRLLEAGATIIVIDHDLDLLAAADHLIDMGPGGGPEGGHILAAGIPEDVARDPDSVTGPWLAEHLSLPEDRQPDVLPGRRASASLRSRGVSGVVVLTVRALACYRGEGAGIALPALGCQA